MMKTYPEPDPQPDPEPEQVRYCRDLQIPRYSPIEAGIPLPGTWTQAFKRVDLRDIRRPYHSPLPRWLTAWRIKEWEIFGVQNERLYLGVLLGNLKYYCWAQVLLFDMESGETLRYRKIVPFNRWKMPKDLANASIDSRAYGFFFRVHDWLDADMIKIDLDIEATSTRPSVTAHVEYEVRGVTPMAVNLLFSDHRCLYAYKTLTPVRGDLVLGGKHRSFDTFTTTGYFGDFKGYYPYRMQSVWCTASGFDGEKRRFGFALGENQALGAYQNNENALWVGGRLTPLPPVRVTMPAGIEHDWIIQDTEGMVDLVFTPQEPIRSELNLVITRTAYNTPLGRYNGMIVDSDGIQIPVRNLWGLGEQLEMRM